MRHISRILIFATTIVILTLSLAMAGAKFTNKDTAKSRSNNSFGTDPGDDTSSTVFGTAEDGSTSIKTKARPKAEPVDWYDKIIISVNPDTKWGDSSSTSTSVGYNNATDTQTTTTTTTSTTNEK